MSKQLVFPWIEPIVNRFGFEEPDDYVVRDVKLKNVCYEVPKKKQKKVFTRPRKACKKNNR